MTASFQQSQFQFARHLRNPDAYPAPEHIEDRRMGIYRDLIYKNIESFIANGFPVLREITDDEPWHRLVRDFIHRHRSQSPYFLEISQEFLRYLQDTRGQQEDDPPFMQELAHYEWVELALDIAEQEIPEAPVSTPADLLQQRLGVSPLSWSLSYQYPVHKISRDYQPASPPATPTFLVVYRNRQDKVRFLEVNALTVRLLQLLNESAEPTLQSVLHTLANEAGQQDLTLFYSHASQLVSDLIERDILFIH
jgi:hypothetical protein